MRVLDLVGVTAGYGSAQVLFGIDLHIDAGEVVSLMGRNGMGKSTTLKSIMGIVPIWDGTLGVMGEDALGRPSHKIAQAGIGYVPEGRHVFPTLSVRENLECVAANPLNTDTPWTVDRVYDLFPRLGERRDQSGATLSGGEQQMLAIGRALMTNPRALLLDEATEGLAPLIREEIWAALNDNLRAAGQAIFIVDQHPDALMRLCDRHYVIEKGQIVWTGSSDDLRAEPDVLHRYLGV